MAVILNSSTCTDNEVGISCVGFKSRARVEMKKTNPKSTTFRTNQSKVGKSTVRL